MRWMGTKLMVSGLAAASLALGVAPALAPALAQESLAYIGTSMFGENEPDGGADEEASGDFSAELDLANGRMCYLLEIEGIDDFTAAHIHEGKAGSSGRPVITLELMGDDGDDVCVDVEPELLKKIARNNERYYVNVHSRAYPKGAIRGQLGDS